MTGGGEDEATEQQRNREYLWSREHEISPLRGCATPVEMTTRKNYGMADEAV